jgi:hypothetical protein
VVSDEDWPRARRVLLDAGEGSEMP